MTEVIPFSPGHEAGVVSVVLPIQQLEFGIAITLEDQPDLLSIPDVYQKGAGNFWVALSAGEVVGTVGLIDIGHGQVALRKMFVRASFRGRDRGVAAGLLQAVADWADQRRLKDVFLGTTSKYLAAHRFYEKNSFSEIRAEDLPEAFPRMAVDTKFYWRAFSR